MNTPTPLSTQVIVALGQALLSLPPSDKYSFSFGRTDTIPITIITPHHIDIQIRRNKQNGEVIEIVIHPRAIEWATAVYSCTPQSGEPLLEGIAVVKDYYQKLEGIDNNDNVFVLTHMSVINTLKQVVWDLEFPAAEKAFLSIKE